MAAAAAAAIAVRPAASAPRPPKRWVVQFSINGHVYHIIPEINIIIVFFISGMALKTEDIKAAWQHKLCVLFGFVSTLALTPCFGFLLRIIPLTPAAYAAGLTVTAAVPQTLGIGITLVRSCGGNEGLALLLTGELWALAGVRLLFAWPQSLMPAS